MQEKEIMKELLENGPVQGEELAGAPLCAPQKVMGGKKTGLGELWWGSEPPSAAPPACPGSAAPVPVTLPTPEGTGLLINS